MLTSNILLTLFNKNIFTAKLKITLVKHLFLTFLLIISLVLNLNTPIAQAANIKQGEQIFNAICSACHARGGNVIMGNKTLNKEALEKYGMDSADKIISQINNGKNAMPAFQGRLKPQEIQNVTAYVLMKAEQGWHKR
jgi:cytochrome c6